MKSGLARLAAALAVTVAVVVLADVIWRHFDPMYNRSVEKCVATAAHALPKGSKLEYRLYRGDVTYNLPEGPAPSADAIAKKLRDRGQLRRVVRRSPDPYDEVTIIANTPCTSTVITVRRVSPPGRGATAEVQAEIED